MSSKTTIQRDLTSQEVRLMRRKHWVMIPVLLVASLILWVVTSFEKLPEPARWAGGAIALLACVIFIWKQVKLELDLREGVVQLIYGEITRKMKMGGRRVGGTGGLSKAKRSKQRSTTFFIYIDNAKFNVPAKIYSKVKEGDKVEFRYFPKSQFCLGISVQ